MTITDILKPREMASLLGVTVKTLQRWDNEGRLIAYRSPTNRRYYTRAQYQEVIGEVDPGDEKPNGATAIYARVSGRGQKQDLANQEAYLREFCNARGFIVSECITEIGSGLNYKRVKWNRLLEQVLNREIQTIVIAEKDRFVRFGFDWFESLCNRFGCEIVVVSNPAMSPDEELVQDIISIIHVFSCRIYGLRKYKTKMETDSELYRG